MSQITISCTCCGSVLTLEEDVNVRECPACGTSNARPKVTGESLLTLQRATEQRIACDFHNAELSYQQVLLYRPDEHEALWGRLLCRYGVEYVEDPATKRRMPTVHTVQMKPLQAQPDFIKACKLAPNAIRAQYELDAAYIDDAQAEIRQKAKSCKPYDVFLCHKTTKPGSKEKTEDFHRATQLYHFLKDQGVKVFFAPECLQDAAGANYEAGIYHALHTAKMMLLVCSEPEYLTSAWVRSEWSRYLDIIEQEPEKQIVPLLYDHFDPDDLPPQFLFASIQGMDMSDINAPQRLTKMVLKAVRKPAPEKTEPVPTPVMEAAPASAPQKPVQEEPQGGYAPASHFRTRRVGNEIVIEKYIGPGGSVHIPPEIDGLPVRQIGVKAFGSEWSLPKIQHVTIPRGVMRIEKKAFLNCGNMLTLELPEGLEYIGPHAFNYCASLTSIHLPDSVKEIGTYCFSVCRELREINCPKLLQRVGDKPFAYSKKLPQEKKEPFRKFLVGFFSTLS